MKVLLDTMFVIAAFDDPSRLSEGFLRVLRHVGPSGVAAISVASLWEIGIKKAQGRLQMTDDLPAMLRRQPNVQVLPITSAHAWRTLALPRFKDHKDPFDRLIIAQALEENLTVITSDKAFARYSVKLITP